MRSKPITLSPHQRGILEKIAGQRTSSIRDAERAKIVLALFGGQTSSNAARSLGLPWLKIQSCRHRWLSHHQAMLAIESGCEEKKLHTVLLAKIHEALKGSPRPGSPGKFTAEDYCRIMGVALEDPSQSGLPITHWTLTELRSEVIKRGIVTSISRAQLGNFLKSGRSKAPQSQRLDDAQV